MVTTGTQVTRFGLRWKPRMANGIGCGEALRKGAVAPWRRHVPSSGWAEDLRSVPKGEGGLKTCSSFAIQFISPMKYNNASALKPTPNAIAPIAGETATISVGA